MSSRTQVWGVLNVTPDSFSDGGQFKTRRDALMHVQAMLDAGADVIDIGGESTRPGASKITIAEELKRVIPMVKAVATSGVPVSIDTMNAEVAHQAVLAGASIINDVSGGLNDPDILRVAAQHSVDIVLMHWRGHSDVMDQLATYSDVTAEVVAELTQRKEAALRAGIHENRIILDPGFGFAKTPEHNWQLLRDIQDWTTLGTRVLVGVSRKRFLSECVADDSDGSPRDRDPATAAVTAFAALHGVWGVCVHDVAASIATVKVASQLHVATKPWEIW